MGVGGGGVGKVETDLLRLGWGDECGCWLGWIGGTSGAERQGEAEEDAVELHRVRAVLIGQVMEVC